MTRKELRDYVDEQRSLDIIPYHVYSALIDGIDTLEQESILEKIRTEIEPKCDRINSLASVLPYTAHREIQELLCEIMDLFEPQKREGEE